MTNRRKAELALNVLHCYSGYDIERLSEDEHDVLGVAPSLRRCPDHVKAAAVATLAQMIVPVVRDLEDNWDIDTTYPPRL